jgi:deoxyribonuclease-4
MSIRIGPAGLGPVKTAIATLEQYHTKGFRACEIAFTYGAYIKKKEDALAIGKRARELDISLSIHASYFVNLNSPEKSKREASKERILECCRVGQWLGVKRVVFHPGYYGDDKTTSSETIGTSVKEMKRVLEKEKINVLLAPETMGKVNVFGSLEEINALVTETGCDFCIDFAHILARDKHVDYERVKRLFPSREWHVHFSGIIYGDKGEKSHKTTTKEEWTQLLKNVPKDKEITIINESPSMIEDCVQGLKIAHSLGL